MNIAKDLLELLLKAPKSQIGINTYIRLETLVSKNEEDQADILEDIISESESFREDSEFAVSAMKILLALLREEHSGI